MESKQAAGEVCDVVDEPPESWNSPMDVKVEKLACRSTGAVGFEPLLEVNLLRSMLSNPWHLQLAFRCRRGFIGLPFWSDTGHTSLKLTIIDWIWLRQGLVSVRSLEPSI